MTKAEILADIRAQFGPKSVLYAEDLAQILGRTISAIHGLKSRGGLPVPVKEVGGRPCVSVYDYVDWLANPVTEEKTEKTESNSIVKKSVPEPKRDRESLGKYLLQLRVQRNFLAEFDSCLEKLIVDSEIDHPDLPTNADLGRDGRI